MPFVPLQQDTIEPAGFVPLKEMPASGFTPIERPVQEPEQPGILRNVALNNPLTAAGETVLNLGSQMVALPVAGLAGLATEAGNALGLTDRHGADVVQDVASAMTYQPRGEMGQAGAELVAWPFEKLAEGARYAGEKTLDITGSPLAATAVDTTINALTMAVGIRKKGTLERAAENQAKPEPMPIADTPKATDPMAATPADVANPQPMAVMPTETTARIAEPLSVPDEARPSPQEMNAPAVLPESRNVDVPGIRAMDGAQPAKSEGFVPLNEVVDGKIPARQEQSGFAPLDNPELNASHELSAEISRPGVDASLPDTPVDQVRNAWAPGAEYVGLGIDKPAEGVVLTDKPIRREDVLIPFMQALDTTLYEGRVKGKSRLGFYIPGKQAVRIKGKSDLEVASHEIAHLIDDRVPEISQAWKQGPEAKTFTNELRGVSYDKGKTYEGFAEFVRLYMTQPAEAKAKAPNFYRWFDDFTQRHEYGPAIQDAQRGMSAWFNQDALHRAQSKIGMQKDLNSALNGVFDRFRQSTVDDLHGLYRMERDLKGKIEPLGAYEIARNTRGAGGMVDGSIRLGAPVRQPDGSFAFAGKGLEKILEPVANELDGFLHYAVGRSAKELQQQGREKLFTREEVNAMLALEKPEYKQAFSEYQQWNSAVLDFAEAHGVVNSQIRQLFNRQQYVPFYRAGQPGAYNAGGVTGNWSGIKKLTGGDENLRPILGNMLQNASMLIEASLKNEARLKIVDLAKQKGGGKFLVRIEADQRPVKIDKAQVKDELLKAAGIDPAQARMGMLDAEQAKVVEAIDQAIEQAPGFFEFMLHNQAPHGNVMAVLRNGKPEYYEVADPLLFRAVQSLDRPAQNWVVRLLGLPKRIGQATITLTPDFMVANLARDTIMASIMSKAGFRPAIDSIRGMASRITSDPAYQEFIANGGGFASYLRDEQTFRAHLERFYTSKGIDYKTVLDTPDKLLYGLEAIADAFEMSSRLGEYKRLREQGAHPRHAAYAAREISTDFAMKGDSRELGFMYDTVMFLRPAVLSWDRMARGLVHDENKGAIAAKAGTLALMSVGLYLLNRDKPEYQDLPDWDKDTAWHFFIPQQDGSTLHLRYPKIWEIGALASVSERTMARLLHDDPALGGHVADIVRNTFHLNLMPQFAAPLYEQATNRNGFTAAPIETPGMENVQPWLRAKPGTSETMKRLGEATRNLPEGLQVPPARAEALLRGYFNTWAMYGLMLTDRAFFGKELPAMRADELPVLRRFHEGVPAKHTRYETEFYDMLGESQRLHGTMRALDKTNRSDIADEYANDPESGRYRELQRAQRNLSAINKDMMDVRRSGKTPEQKRSELDALTEERNALLKSAVTGRDEAPATIEPIGQRIEQQRRPTGFMPLGAR